jgi:DNA-binding NtrC family response regulator
MDTSGKILIVDDEPDVLKALVLMFEDDYEILTATSGSAAVAAVERHSQLDCVILDIRMAKMDGLETASAIARTQSDLPIVFHTGYPGDYSESKIDRELHPFEYVVKGERPERLRRAVRNGVDFHRLRSDTTRLARLAKEQYQMVGKSPAMLEIFRTIEKIAPTNTKVMILGPTGTGKELVARGIHARSKRSTQRLAILNCNHKEPGLVESELFGHLRGSFTTAVADRVGLFQFADGGTVFLDEIGDLDVTTQAKLLRVLETGEMQRFGSPVTLTVDVRLICATHRDLERMVRDGSFREDLYFRLNELTIRLPALRDRREDIPELIDLFIERSSAEQGHGVKVLAPEARSLLIEHDWPGNVRSLAGTIASLLALTPSCLITKDDVCSYLQTNHAVPKASTGLRAEEREFRRIRILQALDRNQGNAAAAARDIQIDPSNLRRMMRELGIESG